MGGCLEVLEEEIMDIYGTNLKMFIGNSETITIDLRDKNKDPIELGQDDRIYLTVKSDYASSTIAFQKIVSNLSGNTAIIDILPNDTSELKYGDYVYDIRWSKGTTFRKTLISGTLTLSRVVSNE